MKYVIGVFMLCAALIGGVIIKMAYDPFTNATMNSGALYTANASANDIAEFQFIPWAIPAIIFIIVVIMWTRGSRNG
jgi:hypothetical protein